MRKLRWAALAAVAAVTLSAPVWAPHLLRRAEWFAVTRVEVSGNRFLPPHEVLGASGIRQGQNVWDDPARWVASLRAHPGIQQAQVTRRLPGTLRVRVEEKQPVAYVLDGALVPATAAGELFPLDPARSPVDLPIVRGAWPDTLPAGCTRALLREIGRLGEMDPGLLADVSEVRPGEGAASLVLSHRLGEIVLPLGVSADRLTELQAVLQDLERRAGASGTDTAARVDVRFEAQIVVRTLTSA